METIFALDVGTRNVVGIIASYEDDKIVVENMISMEHETRAMEDGQIHDISKVAKRVEDIKKALESKIGEELKEVSVAVAGRSLVTQKGFGNNELDIKSEITEEDLLEIELLAIQDALKESDNKEYHCVGYTVSEYKLDGKFIKNPLYQKGTLLEVEILATFLPKIVVDSMFTAMQKAGLEIKNLTLEPIAAISVVIPEDMRKLNLALVDIGAGTADIAITKNGKVIGYEMVPMAGDEITEKIANDFLLEFSEAERVKRALCTKDEELSYTDILGMDYTVDKSDIAEVIEDTVNLLALSITEKIKELNEEIPQAIILIGGGSLIQGLREKVADAIGIPKARVAVRGTEVIKKLKDKTGELKTAEFVTPIGIVEMSDKGRGFKIITIIIDKDEYRVFSFKDKISLMDALLSAGVDAKDLYSRHGAPLTIKLNGKLKIVKGEAGKAATVKVDGKTKSLEDEVEDGAVIELIKHRAGRDAVLRREDLEKYIKKINIHINGEKNTIASKVFINGEEKGEHYVLKDRDEVEIVEDFSMGAVLGQGIKLNRKLEFYLNNQKMEIDLPGALIKRGKTELGLNDLLKDGDKIEIVDIVAEELKIKDILDVGVEPGSIRVKVNGVEVNLGNSRSKIMVNGELKNENEPIHMGDKIEIIQDEGKLPMVSDVFNHYDAENLKNDHKGILEIEVNGKSAEFTTKLKDRDIVKMYYR